MLHVFSIFIICESHTKVDSSFMCIIYQQMQRLEANRDVKFFCTTFSWLSVCGCVTALQCQRKCSFCFLL